MTALRPGEWRPGPEVPRTTARPLAPHPARPSAPPLGQPVGLAAQAKTRAGVARAPAQPRRDRGRRELAGPPCRLQRRVAERQAGRQGRGVGAAGAVRSAFGVAVDLGLRGLGSVGAAVPQTAAVATGGRREGGSGCRPAATARPRSACARSR